MLTTDTPSSIDPFTYVAQDPAQAFKTTFSSAVIGTNLDVKCLLNAEPVAVKTHPEAAPATPSASASATGTTTAASGAVPSVAGGEIDSNANKNITGKVAKVGFPETHLKELYTLIEGNTRIRSDLVSQLRAHFGTLTSKIAIETKIREVAMREGKLKDSAWRVNDDAWVSLLLRR